MCSLSNNIYDYNNVSQGKVQINGVDDGEEMGLTDVSWAAKPVFACLGVSKRPLVFVHVLVYRQIVPSPSGQTYFH